MNHFLEGISLVGKYIIPIANAMRWFPSLPAACMMNIEGSWGSSGRGGSQKFSSQESKLEILGNILTINRNIEINICFSQTMMLWLYSAYFIFFLKKEGCATIF